MVLVYPQTYPILRISEAFYSLCLELSFSIWFLITEVLAQNISY